MNTTMLDLNDPADIQRIKIVAASNMNASIESTSIWGQITPEQQDQARQIWNDFQDWNRNTPGTWTPVFLD